MKQRESLMDIAGDLISVPKPLYDSTTLLIQSMDYMAIAADILERVNALSDDDDDDLALNEFGLVMMPNLTYEIGLD